MRYVVYGAGAIGATIGGRLFEAGRSVVLIARGAHLDALRATGLVLRDPERTRALAVPAVDSPGSVDWADDDVVFLAMKTQDTADAVSTLARVAPATTQVVCAQNGVENERIALRAFDHVYGMCVMLPAAHMEPGAVDAYSLPVVGNLDLGRYPEGSDDLCDAIAADLTASGFWSQPEPRIMRWKYSKLLMNLGNAIEAACGPAARGSELYGRARAEGRTCLAAAGIDVPPDEEERERRGGTVTMRPIQGARRGGGSSWQSLARGTGSVEADYLNGEIVLLGRLHGLPTPVNTLLQQVANEMALNGEAPGSRSADELEKALQSDAPA